MLTKELNNANKHRVLRLLWKLERMDVFSVLASNAVPRLWCVGQRLARTRVPAESLCPSSLQTYIYDVNTI